MNIEESIKILDKFTTGHKLFNIKHSDGLEEAIETLLTAYEKEKEKNKSKSEKELTKIIKNLEDRLNDGITKIPDYDITSDVAAYLKLLDYKKGE